MQNIRTEVANLLRTALRELTFEEQQSWFTHSDIARQLKVKSGRLNDTRKETLEKLATVGVVESRYRPNDGRKIREYRYPVNNHNGNHTHGTGPSKEAEMLVTLKGETVFLLDNFYTALYAYMNGSLSAEKQPPHNMQFVPNDLSADGWLGEAKNLANRLKNQYHLDKSDDVNRVVGCINAKDFEKAYRFLRDKKLEINSLLAEMDE